MVLMFKEYLSSEKASRLELNPGHVCFPRGQDLARRILGNKASVRIGLRFVARLLIDKLPVVAVERHRTGPPIPERHLRSDEGSRVHKSGHLRRQTRHLRLLPVNSILRGLRGCCAS